MSLLLNLQLVGYVVVPTKCLRIPYLTSLVDSSSGTRIIRNRFAIIGLESGRAARLRRGSFIAAVG